jgi:hypothetical protein
LKTILLLFLLNILLVACQTFKDAGSVLRNEKKNSTDEFLIQKKEPLTQPPDFDVLPTPGMMTEKNVKKNEEINIKKMLKANDKKSTSLSKNSTSTESSIINQIKK